MVLSVLLSVLFTIIRAVVELIDHPYQDYVEVILALIEDDVYLQEDIEEREIE